MCFFMSMYVYCMKPPNIKAPKCTLFCKQYFIIQGQRSQGLTGLATAPSEHRDGQLTSETHFESLRAAEAKNSATINQLKYRSRSCITENIALGAWSRANKALGCASCFIGSRPRPRAIFPVMHSRGTLTSI